MRMWVTITDDGERLRPLTGPQQSVAFLALGERRSLVRRTVDRLGPLASDKTIDVLVSETMADAARADVGDRTRIVSIPPSGALREAREALEGAAAVLVQPAEQVIVDEVAYGKAVRRALDLAASSGAPVGLTESEGGDARPTGIIAWPTRLLQENDLTIDRLSDASSCAASIELDAGWIDGTTWHGVHRLLAYVEKPWGYERLWALTPAYAGKVLLIKAGESLSLQYHVAKDETIRIQSGRMRFRAGPSVDRLETHILDPGMSHAIAPGVVHQMEAIDDCLVIEVSTPQLADVVRLEDRYGRT